MEATGVLHVLVDTMGMVKLVTDCHVDQTLVSQEWNAKSQHRDPNAVHALLGMWAMASDVKPYVMA